MNGPISKKSKENAQEKGLESFRADCQVSGRIDAKITEVQNDQRIVRPESPTIRSDSRCLQLFA